jgi:Cys-tRNA(Pro)/Cys-tRNA(Cys) deacylase
MHHSPVPQKPLAIRILEQRRIAHTVYRFDDGIRSASGVSAETGMPEELVYKTLVVQEEAPGARPLLVMVPASKQLDLRLLASGVGAKKLHMASQRDAERLTGLQVGGISALALSGKGFRMVIDEAALAHEEILVSAGARGWDVRLAVADLLAITGAKPLAC